MSTFPKLFESTEDLYVAEFGLFPLAGPAGIAVRAVAYQNSCILRSRVVRQHSRIVASVSHRPCPTDFLVKNVLAVRNLRVR